MKTPVVNKEDYIIYLEDDNGLVFIHCDILKKWTKETKRKLLEDFKLLTEVWNSDLLALHTPADKKHKKFLNMFGFSYFKSIKGLDDNDYDVYIWR